MVCLMINSVNIVMVLIARTMVLLVKNIVGTFVKIVTVNGFINRYHVAVAGYDFCCPSVFG
jgi:hypothetical protein